MSRSLPQKSIRLEGSGPAAALCAAALSQMRGRLGIDIRGMLKPANIGEQPPVILGPQSLKLLSAMGLSERDLIKACAGTFAVGAKFTHAGFCPFIDSAPVMNGVALHQIYSKVKTPAPYSACFTAAHMANADKFVHPSGDDDYRYSIVLDASLFEHYMQRAAAHYGYKPAADDARADITLRAELSTDGIKTEKSPDATMPVSLVYDARKDGITATAFTQSHKYISGTNKSVVDAKDMWTGDIIDAGAGLTPLHPLDHAYMDAIAFSLQSLFDIWPAGDDISLARAEFNRRTGSFIARAADYQSALLILAGAQDEDRAQDSLKTKLTQFLSRGRLVSFDDEPVSDAEWIAYLLAAGAKQARTDPLAAQFSDDTPADIIKDRKEHAQNQAADMMKQSEYLAASEALFKPQRAAS